jgi:outer membrane protein assembly factor BamB
VLLTAAAAFSQETLAPVGTRDQKVVRRWALPGDPRGLAIGSDGTVYVGLAEPQAVVAIDPQSGAVKKRVVLDSEEIASTKELVTLRTDPAKTRLYIANGSDESATILSLPTLAVLREITMEGEPIRDVIPDPLGRYVYLLGHEVHVFDKDGGKELRALPVDDPMAIATTANGSHLAVFATEDFGNTKATVVVLYETKTFKEIAREPLQTDRSIEGALFAASDKVLIAFSRDYLFEKPIVKRSATTFASLINSDRACLPEKSGPQAVTLAGSTLVYAERRCSASGAFGGANRVITPASLYGVDAWAIAFDGTSIIATEPKSGHLTIYRLPRAATVR